jgi:hypothetical protein
VGSYLSGQRTWCEEGIAVVWWIERGARWFAGVSWICLLVEVHSDVSGRAGLIDGSATSSAADNVTTLRRFFFRFRAIGGGGG